MAASSRWRMWMFVILLILLIHDSVARRVKSSRSRWISRRRFRIRIQQVKEDGAAGGSQGANTVVTKRQTPTTPRSTSTRIAMMSSVTTAARPTSSTEKTDETAVGKTGSPTAISTTPTSVSTPIQTTRQMMSTASGMTRSETRVPSTETRKASGTGSNVPSTTTYTPRLPTAPTGSTLNYSSGKHSTEATMMLDTGTTSQTTGSTRGTSTFRIIPSAESSTLRQATASVPNPIDYRMQNAETQNEVGPDAGDQPSGRRSTVTPSSGVTGSTLTKTTTGTENTQPLKSTVMIGTDKTGSGDDNNVAEKSTTSGSTPGSSTPPKVSQSSSNIEMTKSTTTTASKPTATASPTGEETATGSSTTTTPTTTTTVKKPTATASPTGEETATGSSTTTTPTTRSTTLSTTTTTQQRSSSTETSTRMTMTSTRSGSVAENNQGTGRRTTKSTSSVSSTEDTTTVSHTSNLFPKFPPTSAGGGSRCPAGFVEVDDSCYVAISKNMNWLEANDACRSLHHNAYPVVVSSPAKQSAVKAVYAHLDEDVCTAAWTGGQRSNPDSASASFVWKLDMSVWKLPSSQLSGIPQTSKEGCLLFELRYGVPAWRMEDCAAEACVICQRHLRTELQTKVH